jgi:hypothetical protein
MKGTVWTVHDNLDVLLIVCDSLDCAMMCICETHHGATWPVGKDIKFFQTAKHCVAVVPTGEIYTVRHMPVCNVPVTLEAE